MNSNQTEHNIESAAFALGQEAIHEALERAKTLCEWDRRWIEAGLEPQQVVMTTKCEDLASEENALYEVLGRLPPSAPYRSRVRIVFHSFALALTVAAGFAFAYLTFAPFGLGALITIILSAGASTTLMFSLHEFLEECSGRWLNIFLAATAFAAAVVMLFVAAHLRGNIFAYYFKVAITGAAVDSNIDDAGTFYNSAVHLLQLLFGFLAFAMEISGGLIFTKLLKLPPPQNKQLDHIHSRLAEIRQEKLVLIERLVAARKLPAMRSAAFMTAFFRGLYTATQAAGSRTVMTLCVLASLAFSSSAQQVVIEAIDGTGSMTLPGFNVKCEYQKCVDAFADTIEALPAGTHLSVLAITGESFSRPQLLMSRSVPTNRGPLQFIDQIKVGKSRMRAELKQVMSQAPAHSAQTDLLGFFVYVGGLLREQSPSRKVLAVCSDMRNSASGVDIEDVPTIDVERTMHLVQRKKLVADLSGVDVYVEGVHAAQKSVGYWRSLHAFWTEYFRRSGGTLKSFSMAYEPLRIWGP